MPLIRYRIGDTASFSDKQCSCGRGFPMLKEVSGRVFSHFIKKDGGVVHAQFFVGLLFFKSWVKEFKIVQEKHDLIEIHVAPDGTPDQNDIDDITTKIKQVMGDDCRVDFIFVDGIPPSPSGKYLYTISKVK
jgi:phenylacetate-CoA ligase